MLLSGCATTGARWQKVDQQAATGSANLQSLCDDGVSAACALTGATPAPSPQLSILQGVTLSSEARFTVVVPKNEALRYYVISLEPRTLQRLSAHRVVRDFSDWAVDRVDVFHLQPDVVYQLLVFDEASGQLIDKREFETLKTSKKHPTLAIASCMDDGYAKEQAEIWPQLLKASPDVLFLLGDNVYADNHLGHRGAANPKEIWNRYVQTRQNLVLYRSHHLVPVFAVWDDHDYGVNDGDRTFLYKDGSRAVFFSFFPQENAVGTFHRGPGVASSLRAFGLRFFLMDDRSFRSPNHLKVADQTHWGAGQESWLWAELKQSQEPVLLMDGDQFFGGYQRFESYQGDHPENFGKMLKKLRHYRHPVLFVSGDRHLAEITKVSRKYLGYKTYELTTSGIHTTVDPDAFKKSPNPNQLVGVAGKFNYMIVKFDRIGRHRIGFQATAYGLNGQSLFQKSLSVRGK